jgi:hypothetical protein
MSAEDDREKSREKSPRWHRARAARLRANGFTKMAEEHEQIAEMIERRRTLPEGAGVRRRFETGPPSETPRDLADFQSRR